MAIEDVTRADLEQMFANQAELFSNEFERTNARIDRLESKVDDGFADVVSRIISATFSQLKTA